MSVKPSILRQKYYYWHWSRSSEMSMSKAKCVFKYMKTTYSFEELYPQTTTWTFAARSCKGTWYLKPITFVP